MISTQRMHFPSHLDNKAKGNKHKKQVDDLKCIFGQTDWIIEGNIQADKLATETSKEEPFLDENKKGASKWELVVNSNKTHFLNTKISTYTKDKQFSYHESTLCRKREQN